MDICYELDGPATVTVKKVSEGSYVLKDAVIIEFKDVSGKVEKLKTVADGVVTFNRLVKKGFVLEKGCQIARLNDCLHSIVIKDMCATCGKDLREKDGRAGERKEIANANVSMIHHVPELIVSNELAKEIGSADQQSLLNSRKLVLLVDLDQTIIHTTNRPFTIDPSKHIDVSKYTICSGEYATKLRPHTREFLKNLSRLYEMHIITYGQRQYAHKIAELIDPDRTLFRERIMSRDELFSAQHKTSNMKALFPSGDQLIAIIDDRADVWQYSEALIQIKPYRYFREVGDINAPKDCKDTPLPADIDEDAEHDSTLEHIEDVLRRVHSNFFRHYDETGEIRDVKVVISWLKKQVLRDLVIVLSGVVELGKQLERSDAYRLCVQFGAKVENQVTDKTTHVIAGRWGTDKVHQAVKKGIFVVSNLWLYACVEKWLKADEKEFEVTKDFCPPIGRPLGGQLLPEMISIDLMKKETLQDMENEVADALSDDDDDDDEEGDEDEETKEEVEEGDELVVDLTNAVAVEVGEEEHSPVKRKADQGTSNEVSTTKKKVRLNTNASGAPEEAGYGEGEAEEMDGREERGAGVGNEDDSDSQGEPDYGRHSDDDGDHVGSDLEDDGEDTRDAPMLDEDEEEEYDDMAALIERQMSQD